MAEIESYAQSVELRARRRQLEVIAEFGLRTMENEDLSALMDEAVTLVAEHLAVEYAKIFVLQPDGESLRLCAGVGWAEGVVGRATVGTHPDSRAFFLPDGYTLVSEQEPMVVENLPSKRRLSKPPVIREREVRSGITVIIHGQEQPFGILGADTSRRRRFTIDDVNFLQAIANVLAAAVERRKATTYAKAAETSRFRSEFLAEASMLLSSSPNCSSTLACIANLAVPELSDWCTVEVFDEGGAIRSAVAHVDSAKEDLLRDMQVRHPLDPSNTSIVSEVLRTGQSKIVPEIVDMRLPYPAEGAEDLKMLLKLHPTSYMCVPLMTRGRILGVITLVSAKSGRHYGPEDLALAESLARFAALAIENARLHLPELELARGLIQLANKCYKISASSNRNENETLALIPRPPITSRQLQVLELLSEGKNAKEIGQRLHLSEATVRNHIRSLLRTLGARSQLEAVAHARELGLLS